MRGLIKFLLLLFISNSFFDVCYSQRGIERFLIPSDTLNANRAWMAGGFAATTYTVFSIGLYNAWYKKTNRSSFHLFDDSGEWNNLDKVAHSYNAYIQTSTCFDGAIWCGYSENSSILWASSISFLFQSTIEVFDGFSTDWGFSLPDMAGNALGVGLFATQQMLWHEQKFKLKLSAFPKKYPDELLTGDFGTQLSYKQRAEDLYGNAFFTRFLKDYNAQTFWLSFNPGIISNKINTFWPKYLDISFGYGADNLFGGFKNEWFTNGEKYTISAYPRTQQYYLSLDIDLKKIRVKNNLLRTALHIINIIKIPAPALEYNSKGQLKWHWIFF